MPSLNREKAINFIKNKIEKDYVNYYPKEIFQDLKIDIEYQSFGHTFVIIEGYYGRLEKFVNSYNDVAGVISRFVVDSYQQLTSNYYEKDTARKISYSLDIYYNNKIVNHCENHQTKEVKDEFLKVIFSKEKRGIKTRFIYMPYCFDVKVYQTFTPQNSGTTGTYKYVYIFRNMNY